MELLERIKALSVLDFDGHFSLFQEVSNLLNSSDDSNQRQGRDCLIRIIDAWEQIPTSWKPMWEDLIEAVGFYPYIKKYKMTLSDFDARIRQEYHKSEYISDTILHREQKNLSELIFSKKNVIVSAPTSFGKSLLIEEIVASGVYKNIVIIQPTLALLDETRIKLRKYEEKYKIIVRTSQEAAQEKGNIFLLTAERVLEYENMPCIDLLIIDEFYKLSKKREDNRANILNIAFLRITKNPNCRFYLLGPNIDRISEGFIEKYDAVFYKTIYSLVCTESKDKYSEVKTKKGGKVQQEDVFKVLDSLDDQSLIFCSSPTTARGLAFAYEKHLEGKGIKNNNSVPLIEWIQENLSVEWSLVHCLANGIGVHDGSMPKHITSATIKYFNEGKIKFLFCTNTIIEGVNTSAKYVVYYDNKIGKRNVDYFDYSNIRGRAGRLMEHCVGTVINMKKPPEAETMEVDIPAFTQKPIDDEVLVNIEREEVKPYNLNRYEEFDSLPEELKVILKRNAVSIKDQRELLPILKDMMLDPIKKEDIIWSTPRDKELYSHLCVLFDLVKERFVEGKEKNVMISTEWMANQTVNYCRNKKIQEMINNMVTYYAREYLKKADKDYCSEDFSLKKFITEYPEKAREISDRSIECIFKFHKNWLQYKIPKWLNVLDSLQKYVAQQEGIKAGDYSYVAELIENEFMNTNIRILSEYGIPSSAIEKIMDHLSFLVADLQEDQVVFAIKTNRKLIDPYLTVYEKEALDRCL